MFDISQVMYLYYLLGWKLMTKYYGRWQKGEDEKVLRAEIQVRKEEIHMQEHTANFNLTLDFLMSIYMYGQYFSMKWLWHKYKTEQIVPFYPEREAQHLSPCFGWRHRLPADRCDAAHRPSENVPTCRCSMWQDSPHWCRLAHSTIIKNK